MEAETMEPKIVKRMDAKSGFLAAAEIALDAPGAIVTRRPQADLHEVSPRADREGLAVAPLGPLEHSETLSGGPRHGARVQDLAVDRHRDIGAPEIVAAHEPERRRGERQERGDAEQDHGHDCERKAKAGLRGQSPNRGRNAGPDLFHGLPEAASWQS
jgi:hypothetical protein